MRRHFFRFVVATVVGTASLASAQPFERDHRGPPRPVVEAVPREAPPPPRPERFTARAGFVWIPGRWQWNRGRYDWVAGHYERERANKRWREGRWELQNGAYVWIEGDWMDLDLRPRAAPPALREEVVEKRPGFVYVRGRWDWRNGNWEWLPGHYEKKHHGKRWREARWELRDGAYVLVDGDWEDAAYPVAAPPELQIENPGTRPGHIWVRGRWNWVDGEWAWQPGHWERERAHQRWAEGRWEMRDGRYTWVEGSWTAPALYPEAAPPALQVENPGTRAGFVWVSGRWDWKDGQWAWMGGHWERERANMRWNPGAWQMVNGRWTWVEGSWTNAAPPVVEYEMPAPPELVVENPGTRSGFVWVRGHHAWNASTRSYTWQPGHWERERANKHWVEGRWERRGREWFWVEGGWQ